MEELSEPSFEELSEPSFEKLSKPSFEELSEPPFEELSEPPLKGLSVPTSDNDNGRVSSILTTEPPLRSSVLSYLHQLTVTNLLACMRECSGGESC